MRDSVYEIFGISKFMCVSKKTERGKFLEDFPTNEKLEVKSKSKPYKFQNENNTHNLVKNQRKEKKYQLM